MKPNPILETPVNIQDEIPDYRESKKNLGIIDSLRTGSAISNASRVAIIDVEKTRIQAQADLAVLNIQIVTQQLKQSSLMSNIHTTGVLMERLDSTMATVDKALTNTQACAMYIHEKNYQDTRASFSQLNLPEEQFESIDAVLHHNKLADQRRSQERMEASKNSVQKLHTATTQGVDVFKKII